MSHFNDIDRIKRHKEKKLRVLEYIAIITKDKLLKKYIKV